MASSGKLIASAEATKTPKARKRIKRAINRLEARARVKPLNEKSQARLNKLFNWQLNWALEWLEEQHD